MAQNPLTLQQAADSLGISPMELEQRREQGEIDGFDQDGEWMFDADAVESLRAQMSSESIDLESNSAMVLEGNLDSNPDDDMQTAKGMPGKGGDVKVTNESKIVDAEDQVAVLGADLDGDPTADMQTIKGTPGRSIGKDSASDEVAVLGGHLDGDPKADMQTIKGGPASSQGDEIKISTGESKIVEDAAVLGGNLDGDPNADMQTIKGSNALSDPADDQINITTGDSNIAVLGDDLDVDPNADMQTMKGASPMGGGGPGNLLAPNEDEIRISTGDSQIAGLGDAAAVLGDDLDVDPNADMQTIKGGAAQMPSGPGNLLAPSEDEIRISTGDSQIAGLGDAAVLGDELDVDPNADMQTMKGASPMGGGGPGNLLSPSEDEIRISTGDSNIMAGMHDDDAAVLDGHLDADPNADMQTIKGQNPSVLTPGVEDEILISTGDSSVVGMHDEGHAVLGEELDVDPNADMQTMKGTAPAGPGNLLAPSEDEVYISTGDSVVQGSNLLEDELNEASEETDSYGTVLGTAGKSAEGERVNLETPDDRSSATSDVLGHEELAVRDPGASRTVVGHAAIDGDVELHTRHDDDDDQDDVIMNVAGHTPAESDVRLASDPGGAADSDIRLAPVSSPSDSDLRLGPVGNEDETLSLHGVMDLEDSESEMSISLDDADLEPTSALSVSHEPPRPAADDDATIDLTPTTAEADLGSVFDDDEADVLAGGPGTSDITIGSSTSGIGLAQLGSGDSGLSLEQPGDSSAIDLDADDEDEFVLGGSSKSDITLRPGESGIGIGAGESGILLNSLAGSGVNLEAPLDLGDAGSSVGGDSEFLLQPVAEGDDDDSEDSGSQVIALDAADADFQDGAATMLGPDSDPGYGSPMLDEEPLHSGFGTSGAGASMPAASYGPATSGPQPSYVPAGAMPQTTVQYEDIPYTPLNLLSLFFGLLFVVLSGFLSYDLMSNMWEWKGTTHYSGQIMDGVVNLFEPER